MSRVQRVVSVLAFAMIVAAHASASAQLRGATLSFDDDGVASRVRLSRRVPGIPSQVWSLFGNRSTDPAYDFLGTTDAASLAIRTANQERLRVIGNTLDPQANHPGWGTGRVELYTDLWVRADQREPWIPLDYPFRVTPDLGSLTVSNDGQVEIYSPVFGFPLLAAGDTGSLSVANTGQVVIDAPVPGLEDALRVIGDSGEFQVSGNGRVTIRSTHQGSDAAASGHALIVDAADQGIAISVDHSTPSGSDNFVTFFNRGGNAVGRIEGQTFEEWLISWDRLIQVVNVGGQSVALLLNITSDVASDKGWDWSDTISLGTLLLVEAGTTAKQLASLGVAFESGGADYAEYLERVSEGETMSSGDIVGVFGGRVTKRTAGARQFLVVSAAPAVVGNLPAEGKEHLFEKVSLLGQVHVKVIGPVEEGDYIIPSGLEDGSGVAVSPEMMTADEFTKIVGRAWDSYPSAGLKYVKTAVGMNSGDVARLVKAHEDEIAALRAEIAQNREAATTSLAELNALRADIATLRQTVLEATQPGSTHRQTAACTAGGTPGAG